ncbi:MAG: sodium-dependent transporter [Sphaerochaetaceae bacterium]|nr:sodium-dependent transporter [Sphaerochaetaceae bacterium]
MADSKRESFKSRIGFLMVSAGCAIGVGNIWKFPWLCGQNGGGIFVLFYLIFLVVLGIPVMSMEFAVGRASRQSTVKGFRKLEPKGSGWHVYGYFAIAGNVLLMMFYTSVAGWLINYFVKFLTGYFSSDMPVEAVTGTFGQMLSSVPQSLIYAAIAIIAGGVVCYLGVRKGVEKVTKVMMSCLLVLIVILAINSLTLRNAGEGLLFYLVPDFEKAAEIGYSNIIVSAMNQAFFTLSLGIGAMEIFGTYMSEKNSITGEAVRITILDTFVALMAGLIIFPACFSFGINPGAGPELIFITLPNVFINMAGGRIWGSLFFLFMVFAAMSTVIAVFENIIASFMDLLGWSRKKSTIVTTVGVLILSLPVIFEYNLLEGFQILRGRGRGPLDSWDFLVSNLLLPIGSLIYLMFCCSKAGWGYENFIAECNKGTGMRFPRGKVVAFFVKFCIPVLIIFILVMGL